MSKTVVAMLLAGLMVACGVEREAQPSAVTASQSQSETVATDVRQHGDATWSGSAARLQWTPQDVVFDVVPAQGSLPAVLVLYVSNQNNLCDMIQTHQLRPGLTGAQISLATYDPNNLGAVPAVGDFRVIAFDKRFSSQALGNTSTLWMEHFDSQCDYTLSLDDADGVTGNVHLSALSDGDLQGSLVGTVGFDQTPVQSTFHAVRCTGLADYLQGDPTSYTCHP